MNLIEKGREKSLFVMGGLWSLHGDTFLIARNHPHESDMDGYTVMDSWRPKKDHGGVTVMYGSVGFPFEFCAAVYSRR